MEHIILSIPELYLYPVFLVLLLIAALLERDPGPPTGKPRAIVQATERGVSDARVTARGNLDRAPLASSIGKPSGDHRSFRDLEATLSATYAAQLEQALRMIRTDRPTGATDQAAG
jgi:hypothetical protein